MEFSQIVKSLRLERGWSQQEVADRAGLNKMTISQYENGKRKPEPFKCCETCANMQPIGEGDHICDACCSHDGSPTALVLESYIPADDYFICEGSRWTPQ